MFKSNDKAIYLQIADRICDGILSGEHPSGSRLPSVREYAANVQVNANTVMRTYERLAAEEVIVNKRGIGYFIAPDAPDKVRQMRHKAILNDEIYGVFRQLHLLGIDPDTLKAKYEEYLRQSQSK